MDCVLVGPRRRRSRPRRRPPGPGSAPTRITHDAPAAAGRPPRPVRSAPATPAAPFTWHRLGVAGQGVLVEAARPARTSRRCGWPSVYTSCGIAVVVDHADELVGAGQRSRGRRRWPGPWPPPPVPRRPDTSAGHGGMGAHVARPSSGSTDPLALFTLTRPRTSSQPATAPAMLASPNRSRRLRSGAGAGAGAVAQDPLVEAERRVDGGQVAHQPRAPRPRPRGRTGTRRSRPGAPPRRPARPA